MDFNSLYDINIVLALIAAYTIGSISFGVVLSRALGLNDPRKHGSGNPGATNVLRLGHKRLAIFVLALDALKGSLAVIIGIGFGLSTLALSWVVFAVILGHCFPIFFKFKGGKGIATAYGSIVTWNVGAGMFILAIWIVMLALKRYSSLASICACFSLIVGVSLFAQWSESWGMIASCILVIFQHRANIKRLKEGTEPKVGQKS